MVLSEQGMGNWSGRVSYRSEAAMARNTSALEQGLAIPPSNLPFQRTAGTLALEEGRCDRTRGIHLEVEVGKSADAMGIVAVLKRSVAVVTAEDNSLVDVGIQVEMVDKSTAGADTARKSAVVGGILGKVVVAIVRESLEGWRRLGPPARMVGVGCVEVGCAEVGWAEADYN